jgi:hypothetical protein
VLIVHGTRKFLDRVGRPTAMPDEQSTKSLGDWYATAILWRPQVALFVNETTLLPVLLPLAPAASVVDRFRASVAEVLRAHGISRSFVEAEVAQMSDHRLATTKNRSVVGIMNEFTFLVMLPASRARCSISVHCRCGSPGPRAGRCTAGTAVPTANSRRLWRSSVVDGPVPGAR